MLNLSRIFYSELDSDRFHNRIKPAPDRHASLVQAKNDIRDHLRPRIKAATVSLLGMSHPVEPRFRSQGSQRYKACLDPAHLPPQEMDWDYGIYLPVTVWEDNGPPHAMAKAYFDLVEGLLKDLCKQKGWTLVSGKDSCVRVQVASWGHIDLPLYAASEREFSRIVERAALSGSLRKRAGDSAQALEYYDRAREQAAGAERRLAIGLAHRRLGVLRQPQATQFVVRRVAEHRLQRARNAAELVVAGGEVLEQRARSQQLPAPQQIRRLFELFDGAGDALDHHQRHHGGGHHDDQQHAGQLPHELGEIGRAHV
mgnify:CR=1 FL=1